MKGIFIILIASLFNANFTLPMKFTRKWDWEHAWGMWAFWACLVLPVLLALATIPHLPSVYAGVPAGQLLLVLGASFIWGLSAIAFGLGVAMTGIAVGFSVIMGIVITVGTLVPLVVKTPGTIATPTGVAIIVGLLAMITGIFFCGKAGRRKEQSTSPSANDPGASKNTTLGKGIWMCILAGVFGPMINFSFIFGEPVQKRAIELGANPFWATNAVWALTLFGGFLANAGYCAWLITKRKSWGKLCQSGVASHWIYGLLMGVFFMTGITLYGVGTASIGALGTSIGWALFQGPTILIANLSGLATGEWKGAGTQSRRTMLQGVAAILVGIIILALAKQ